MHVHQNQISPNAQLDAMYAAQKAAAQREAERTRKKLLELASTISGEADEDACVVELGAREDSHSGARQQEQRAPRNLKKQEQSDSAPAESSISDWA
jgi:hypothetical protein